MERSGGEGGFVLLLLLTKSSYRLRGLSDNATSEAAMQRNNAQSHATTRPYRQTDTHSHTHQHKHIHTHTQYSICLCRCKHMLNWIEIEFAILCALLRHRLTPFSFGCGKPQQPIRFFTCGSHSWWVNWNAYGLEKSINKVRMIRKYELRVE